jgi:hypothetical protein
MFVHALILFYNLVNTEIFMGWNHLSVQGQNLVNRGWFVEHLCDTSATQESYSKCGKNDLSGEVARGEQQQQLAVLASFTYCAQHISPNNFLVVTH